MWDLFGTALPSAKLQPAWFFLRIINGLVKGLISFVPAFVQARSTTHAGTVRLTSSAMTAFKM